MTTDTLSTTAVPTLASQRRRRRWAWGQRHPIWALIIVRTAIGAFVLWAVSVLIFFATQVLPGNAATAFLGPSATPERVAKLVEEMGLNRPIVEQYLSWVGNILRGDAGVSLITRKPVAETAALAITNTAVLVAISSIIGLVLALLIGMAAAWRRGKVFDRATSVVGLILASLPEFVIALVLVMLFAVNVFRILPAVSSASPGQPAWTDPRGMVLPVLTLVLLVIPYAMIMIRAAVVESLESDSVELARLKGQSAGRLLFVYALPNALAPIIQVIGLNLLLLAGGVVVVEYVFNYPGLGSALVEAITNRDVPIVQYLVLTLAAFYVVINIITDVFTLVVTPRRRSPR